MRNRKKKGQDVRTREWADDYDAAFSHDRARHRRGQVVTPVQPPAMPEEVVPNAVVINVSGQHAFVHMNGEEVLCLIDPALGMDRSSVLAAGDLCRVEFENNPPGGAEALRRRSPVVRGVAARRTRLSRLAHEHSALTEQVIAANVDLLVILATPVMPRFKAGVVDRYLVTAQVGGVAPVLIINKMDLVDNEPSEAQAYRDLGVPVFAVSCLDGRGIEAVRAALDGKTSVVAGQSGVGKSSLLNALAPHLDIETREVSALNDKGRHTTTTARLYILDDQTRIIDTPGVRQLGLWGVSAEEVAFYFPELAEYASACKFRDCTHTHEPRCAVRDAVEQGGIPRVRYVSYLRVRASLEPAGPTS